MEPEKSKASLTARPAAQAGPNSKSETVEDEKASLVKAGRLPAYLQRAAVVSEEEKEKLILQQKAAQMQKLSSVLYKEAEKKK